jgi:hypothetical protein
MQVLHNTSVVMWNLYWVKWQSPSGILHCKKSWRKTPPAWSDVKDSLVRGTENFFDMKIEVIRQVLTTKTEYFKIIGISRRFFVPTRRSFPTIFRQLSDQWINTKSSNRDSIPRTSGLQSTTLPLRPLSLCDKQADSTQYFFTFVSTVFSFVSTVLPLVSTLLFFVSTLFTSVNTVFFLQYCVNLRQYCVFLRQYSVHLRQYSVFLP